MMCHSIIICKPITTSNILIEIELMMQILPLYLPDAEFEQLKLNPSKSDRKYIRYQEFLREHAQATEQEIATFEQEYPIELPDEYREFLKQNNGGRPELDCFKDEVINYFLGVLDWPGSFDSIQHMISQRYPVGMLPIASTGGGDLLLLGWKGEFKSKIYYWSHDWEAEGSGEYYFDNVEWIADSLTDFLTMLYELEDDEFDYLGHE